MATGADIRAALADTHAFYRQAVRRSWVFKTLFDRNLADQLRPAAIGFAPPGWAATTSALRARGHTDETLVAAGISRESTAGLTDVMRDRMIFPIKDEEGQLIGFVGRARPDAAPETPKYLNTPATALYRKSAALYGLEALDAGAAVWPVIVEGPLDRLAMLKAIQGTQMPLVPLATCGTALTSDHLQQVRRRTVAPFVLAFDGDPAGRAAVLRAWDLLKTEYPHEPHRAIGLPSGTDPADLVGGHRTRDLLKALSMPLPLENQVATIRRGDQSLDHLKAIMQVTAFVGADLDALPVDHVTEWICHLGHLYGLPATEVNEIVLDHAAPEPDGIFAAPPVPTPPVHQGTAERRANHASHRFGIER